MGIMERFLGRTVFIDSAPFIYYIEEHPRFADVVETFFISALQKNELKITTSVITIAEVLVHPYREKNDVLVREYEDIFGGTADFPVLPINRSIAKKAAKLRADYSLKTPDALQLATAIMSDASFFLTNDKALSRVRTIEIVLMNDFN